MTSKKTYLFHITNIDNLESIIGANGLFSKNGVIELGIDYTSIAKEGIQHQRSPKMIPLPPGGCLHDYVPFFFWWRPPMLCSISHGNVPTYSGSQEEIVYLITTVELIVNNSLEFVFTDGHAIMEITQFYNSINDLSKLYWPQIKAKYWVDTSDCPDRKRRKQAEFLVYRHLPWSLIKGIAVFDESMLFKVNAVCKKHRPKVLVKQAWYY